MSATPIKRVVVVGGGITGLAAAHRLIELSGERGLALEVLLVEGSQRLGGNIVTTRRDGFLIEGGPDAFITQKPAGLALCGRIGLGDHLIGTNPACRRTYIVRDGALYPVPEGFLLLAPSRIWPFVTSRLFSWRGKARMAMDLVLPRRDHGTSGDESLADFVRRRFGHEALERIAQPMVGGIYTADPERLGLRATMPRFLEMENQYGSVIRAMRAEQKAARARREAGSGAAPGSAVDSGARYSLFVSFREGMSTLIDRLVSFLPPESLRIGSPVVRVEKLAQSRIVESIGLDKSWRVRLSSREGIEAHGVILACPAHVSAHVVRKFDEALARELQQIEYASSATMTLAYRSEQISRQIDGFGFVVPALERRTILAVTLSSTKFENRAPQGYVLLRAFLGGALHPQVYALPDDALRAAVLADLRELMGVRGEPLFSQVYRWPASMPQYPVGHLERVERIGRRAAQHLGLLLAGSAFGGVGIPDCIASGESAADALVERLAAERHA